jgi:hypothetical protein
MLVLKFLEPFDIEGFVDAGISFLEVATTAAMEALCISCADCTFH